MRRPIAKPVRAPAYSLVASLEAMEAQRGASPTRQAAPVEQDGPADGEPTPTRKVRSGRLRSRAAAEEHKLAVWRAYRVSSASSQAEVDAIEREYAERLAAGPDCINYRRGSDFSEPPVHEIDRTDQDAQLAKFDAIRWELGRHRAKGEQMVSHWYRDVLKYFTDLALGKSGQVYPSYAGVAEAIGCCRNTVIAAVKWLEQYGFLTRQRRLKRVITRLGTRVQQTSNAYRILVHQISGLGAAAKRWGLAALPDVAPESKKLPPSKTTTQKRPPLRVRDRPVQRD